jgi:general secretion pathway protein B
MIGSGQEGDRVMSYILDALKKLEHEKTRKSRGDGTINISGALFEQERPRPSGVPGWKIVLAITVAVVATFGVTWQFVRPGKGPRMPSPRIAAQVPSTPSAPAASPAVQVQQVPPAQPAAPALVSPTNPPAQSPIAQKTAEPAVPVADDDAEELAKRELRRRTSGRKRPAPSTEQATVAPATPAPADIKLSGIAWQEERRARRAVVNGFLMQEGGVVSGARITEILADRVRFTQSGKTFELPLAASGVPAAGK